MVVEESTRWNRNIHYHTLLLELGPARRALDVGCGGGMLTRQLSALSAEAIGIDPHEPSIDEARSMTAAPNVEYVLGDVALSIEILPGSTFRRRVHGRHSLTWTKP